MTTVDWTTPEQQHRMLREYRETIRRESDNARATNYRAMDAAIRAVRS